jgi:tRNA A-37 threonylcarbamoyl transferase component Bud32
MNEETLFHLAREKSPDQRGEFLDEACAGDAELRQRVEVLLRADEAAGSFLARPAAEPAAAAGAAATLAPDVTMTGRSPAAKVRYFGDYELLEEIAQGGMGVVWKARQSNLHRDVALKMIRAGTLATSAEVARFHREAEAAANLQHPNIVAIHEVGEHEGRHYFSMDLVEGRDLGAIVAEGPLAPQRAARYVKIIAEAIHFAHQRGTLHRDLKPQNILIDAADQPRITDFGLAKTTSDSQLTQSGIIMGSPSYMPPEQAAGRLSEIGPASDVYSLGAMLYELLTGRPPFRGETAMATLRDVLETEPTALRKLKVDVPPDLETICLTCLEKSPAARYPTARALAEELDRFLKGDPILARPADPVRKLVSWCRRHTGLLATLAALPIVWLAFGAFFQSEENAFLRAKLANPGLRQVPGPLRDFFGVCCLVNLFFILTGIFVNFLVGARARGLSIRGRMAAKDFYTRSILPLDDRTRNLALAYGLILLAIGVVVLAAGIRADVWEGGSSGDALSNAIIAIWIGLLAMGHVVRDYRAVTRGVTVTPVHGLPQATEEQRAVSRAANEKALAAMQKWDQQAAIRIYRDAGLTKRDAMVVVLNLGKKLRTEQPDKFAYPPLSIADMSWKGILICALIEVAVLGGMWWHTRPLTVPIATTLLFACGFLFGMGIMAFSRVKDLWKRTLLLTPFLMTVVSQALMQSPGWQMRVAACILGSIACYIFSSIWTLGFTVAYTVVVRWPWLKVVLLTASMTVIAFVLILLSLMSAFGLFLAGFGFGAVLMASGLAGEAGRALRRKLSQPDGGQP